jgi:hypothetical protein
MTTVGSANDYRHFLPRILELAVEEGGWMGADPPIIAQKLSLARWEDWLDREREAIISVFDAGWAQARRMHPDDIEAEIWLCGLAALGVDVRPRLSNDLVATVDGALQVASFLASAPPCLGGDPEGRDAYWEYAPSTACEAVSTWLDGNAVAEALAWADGRVAGDDAWRLTEAAKATEARASRRLVH